MTVVFPAPGTEKFAPFDSASRCERSRSWKSLSVLLVKPSSTRRASISSTGNNFVSCCLCARASFSCSEKVFKHSVASPSGRKRKLKDFWLFLDPSSRTMPRVSAQARVIVPLDILWSIFFERMASLRRAQMGLSRSSFCTEKTPDWCSSIPTVTNTGASLIL